MMTALLFLLAAAAPQEAPKGFKIDGDRWTFSDGARSQKGILLKPEGKGPFPALLISHGMGGSAETFSLQKAREFVQWGLVCVATDYTHIDPKGDRKTFGASEENIARAKTCLDLLAGLPYVDPKRVAAYGNSMGAFLTIGLAAALPDRIAAAAITAGGVNTVSGFPAPAVEEVAKIKASFLILHGAKDATVPPERSQLLKEALDKASVASERKLWEGVSHNLHQEKADEVYAAIKEWFRKRGVLPP